ncbi:MAG: hypothetical protein KGZ50_05355 [Peptococcaceae bacterium]|nr:hypothetical protein [Peptococcaceae bacterium]
MLIAMDRDPGQVTLCNIYKHEQWSTVVALYNSNCAHVPVEKGVYFVVVPKDFEVQFSAKTAAIEEHGGHLLLYPAEELARRFQASDKKILYIGKASGENNRLRQRLSQLVRYAYGEGHNHLGGRALWQICNAHQLLIGYLSCEQSQQVEANLLHEYVNRFGILPVANWQLPNINRLNTASYGIGPASRSVSAKTEDSACNKSRKGGRPKGGSAAR